MYKTTARIATPVLSPLSSQNARIAAPPPPPGPTTTQKALLFDIEALPSHTRLVQLDEPLTFGVLFAAFQHARVAHLLRFRTAATDFLAGLDADLVRALFDYYRGGGRRCGRRRVSHGANNN